MKISAVIVTRGDRDISDAIDSINPVCGGEFDEIIVWDNSKAIKDLKVFGRFAGAFIARNDFIYIQDDDCLILTKDLVSEFISRTIFPTSVLCNFPHDRRNEYQKTGIALLGWGTIFHKSQLSVFDKYLTHYPMDDLFLRECDRIFSYLTRNHTHYTEVEMRQLPYAFGNDRMGKETRHSHDLRTIRERLNGIDRMFTL